jgi:cyanophycin synthetase
LQPAAGEPRPVGEAIVDHLFPEGKTGRVPVVGVTGTNGKTTVTLLIAHILGQVYRPVGMTCTEGIYLGSRRYESGDCSGPKSAWCVLQNPAVEAAVLETARGGILREGLGFDQCDVAVITNIGEGDHLGCAHIDTPERLAWVKSTLVGAVTRTGSAVLNAADPLVVGMAEQCRGSVIYFARDGGNPVLFQHRANGGRAAYVRNHKIILAEGDHEFPLISLDLVPLTQNGRIGFHVENALASAAAAWALGVPLDAIRNALEVFGGGLEQAPGRFNVLDIDGSIVILDYGHNPSSLASVLAEMEQFPHPHRAAVYSAAGDRRDCDLVRQGEMLGNAFDRVILYEDAYLRGRKEGEIMALFRQGLAKGKRVREIHEVRGGCKAAEVALATSFPGELILLQPDTIDDSISHLYRTLGDRVREITIDEAVAPPRVETPVEVPVPVGA